jgi:hypothetical protein
MQTTGWHNKYVTPFYIGVYECLHPTGGILQRYWDGEKWLMYYGRPSEVTFICDTYLPWRGMAYPEPGFSYQETNKEISHIYSEAEAKRIKSINDVKHITPGLWTHMKYYFGRVVSFFKRLLGFQ